MRVLITGGAGFAGHHLVEHLLTTTDWEIVVLDSLTYAGKIDRLVDCEGYDPTRVSVIWHDLRAPLDVGLDRSLGEITAVLHLASASHVDRSITEPVYFIQNNVFATLNLLEWARTRPELTHFIQVSTDEIYGPSPEGEAHSEWDPHLPSNPYSASKACQEDITIAWWRTFGVPVVITNTMNMFGQRQFPEKFVPMAIKKILNDEPVPIHAKFDRRADTWISSSRHWLHARNHADALKWILENERAAMFPYCEQPDRWNIVGEEHTAGEIAQLIATVLGREGVGEFVDYHTLRPGHDHRYALDGSKLRDAGWEPPVDFHKSLEQTVQWTARFPQWLES